MYWFGPFVAGRDHDHHARLGGIGGGLGVGRVLGAEGRPERHVDHVQVVVDGPFDRVDHHVGRAVAAEHPDRVQVGLRRDPRTDSPAVAGNRRPVVRAGIGCAAGQHARARRRAGYVRAVADGSGRRRGAVERVGIRMRDRLVGGGTRVRVVAVADQIGAALDARGRWPEQRRVRRRRLGGVGSLVRVRRSRTAEVGMGVVDAGVDDADLDAFAVEAQGLPDRRRADHRHAVHVGPLDRKEGAHRDHARQRRQLRDLVAGNAHLDAVVGGLVVRHHGAAQALDVAMHRALRAAQLRLDLFAFAAFELAARVALLHGHRVARQLDDDRHGLPAQCDRQLCRLDQAASGLLKRRPCGLRVVRHQRGEGRCD